MHQFVVGMTAAALLAVSSLGGVARADEEKVALDKVPKAVVDAVKARFATAATDFLRIVPKSDIEPNLRYQIADDLFAYGHYDEALPLFESLVGEFPRSDQAKGAVQTLLSYHLKHDHWDEMVRLGTAWLNNRSVKGKNLRDYIKENMDYARGRQS